WTPESANLTRTRMSSAPASRSEDIENQRARWPQRRADAGVAVLEVTGGNCRPSTFGKRPHIGGFFGRAVADAEHERYNRMLRFELAVSSRSKCGLEQRAPPLRVACSVGVARAAIPGGPLTVVRRYARGDERRRAVREPGGPSRA